MLYTGKGDKGTTKFFDTEDGKRISKNSGIPETLGALDELNSFVGLCKVKASKISVPVGETSIDNALEEIQQNLFMVQAEVAGDTSKKISQEKTAHAETLIHAIEKEIPPIVAFTVVGGTELSALLDVARTLARKAERTVVGTCESGERKVSENARRYLNRLSSVLFALARYVNHKAGVEEKNPKYT